MSSLKQETEEQLKSKDDEIESLRRSIVEQSDEASLVSRRAEEYETEAGSLRSKLTEAERQAGVQSQAIQHATTQINRFVGLITSAKASQAAVLAVAEDARKRLAEAVAELKAGFDQVCAELMEREARISSDAEHIRLQESLLQAKDREILETTASRDHHLSACQSRFDAVSQELLIALATIRDLNSDLSNIGTVFVICYFLFLT